MGTKKITPHRKRRRMIPLAWLFTAAIIIGAACGGLAARANATPADYFTTLTNNGMVIWDYPLVLRQGYVICAMLYDNVNPYWWLVGTNGYDPYSASTMITSAQVGLCPGNSVTGSPQLDYLT